MLLRTSGFRGSLILLAVASAAWTAHSSSRKPRVHFPPPNVLVAEDRTEPVIAADPRNPRELAGGSNTDYDATYPLGFPDTFFYSRNGGNSWSVGNVPIREPFTTEADPSIAFDSHGVAYFVALGEAPSYCTDSASAVLLSRSTDGGRHWSYPSVVDGGSGAHDKPYLAVESFAHGPDHVFVAWDRELNDGTELFIDRSTDGGRRFSSGHLLEQSSWANFGAIPVVGSKRHITVLWSTYPRNESSRTLSERIVSRTSTDDGVTWRSKVSPSGGYFTGLPNLLNPEALRVLSSPAAVGLPGGYLYATWAAVHARHKNGTVSADIMLAGSRNGRRWSRPVRVNTSRTRDRFMPTIAAAGRNHLEVAFYDRRSNGHDFDVYAAGVTGVPGHLKVGANIRLNSGHAPASLIHYVPNTSCFFPGRFFGDYISSAVDRWGYYHVIWADTQRQAPGVTDIWTTSLKAR
jgi:hypothetical protein